MLLLSSTLPIVAYLVDEKFEVLRKKGRETYTLLLETATMSGERWQEEWWEEYGRILRCFDVLAWIMEY